MKPEMFLADIERKPEALEALALSLGRENPWSPANVDRGSHLVLLGMGSSHYANGVAAARRRALAPPSTRPATPCPPCSTRWPASCAACSGSCGS